MVKVYIPRDTTSLAMGAERLAAEMAVEAKNRGAEIEIVRNSSRGLFWLEPLVEVETANGRVAYGPVEAKDIDSLFDADFVNGSLSHPLCQGLTEEIPYLKKQQRLTFARAGITDPVSLEDYQAHDGYKGLQKALAMSGQEIVDEVKKLRPAWPWWCSLPYRYQVADRTRCRSTGRCCPEIHRL